MQVDGNGFCIVRVGQRESVSVWKVSFHQLFIFLKLFIKHSNDMYQFISVCLYCFCLLNPGVFQVFQYSQVFVSLCIWITQTSTCTHVHTHTHNTHSYTHTHTHTHTHYADYGGGWGCPVVLDYNCPPFGKFTWIYQTDERNFSCSVMQCFFV